MSNPHGDGAIRASCNTNDCFALRAFTPSGVGLLATGEIAVSADAVPNGIGVAASGGLDGSEGVALSAAGPTQFTRSGVATIPAEASSTTVILGAAEGRLAASSLILATPQMKPAAGVFVQAAVPDVHANSFTIYLNRPAASSLRVGWFIVN